MGDTDNVPVDDLKKLEVGEDDELTPGYKAPAKVDLQTIQKMDAEDESLAKYKADLLKGAEDVYDEGGNNVLVKKLTIMFEGHDDVVLDLGDLKLVKENKMKMKEGTSYKLKIDFRVQRDIVSGLKFFNVISRKGIKVDKTAYMVGSYGPKKEVHSYTTQSEEAPKGMLARGHYTVKSRFTDDDKESILEWEWSFDISKDW